MQLEDVTIEGFKSFSEPSLMSFQPGIGVIIGNNGVGKSNILDAIGWAMGEDDLRKLRCHGEDELFFCGSADHPPSSRARVELNFRCNGRSDGETRQITRVRSRTGGDRYQIDGREMSRAEYLRELERLKIPHALVTIIRQEHINDLVSLDPWKRFAWVRGVLGEPDPDTVAACLLEEVAPRFYRYLQHLFPEGRSRLEVLGDDGRRGLEVEVSLPGNRRRKVHQLSGGEKSVTSLALKLALFQQLESPFYLMDEVEPALDYTNHKAMQELLKELARERQIIMITHLRSTIELADTVHGTRVRKDGSSFMKFHFVMDERFLRLFGGPRG
jgi:chromosome segregation protein